MELVHLHLVKEYIIRLSKPRLVLKSAEQQQQLAGHILANANLIQRFCTQNVSPGSPCPSAPLQTPLVPTCAFRARDAFLKKGHLPLTRPVLQGSPGTWLHQALPTLAEIIRLQDPSAIKIEVATYATSYPDFR